ncbi:hypothetical protein KKB18_02400, partial [bacterium]|nr:hypothetical protein [bacterium]
MLSKDEIFDVILKALSLADGDQVEALLLCDSNSLTRFSNSIIHQNVSENDSTLYIRTIRGKKIGTAISNSFLDDDIKKVII